MGMITEFKDFINKGNVMDLAVGVVIGGAFGKIVDSFVSHLINPIVGMFTGGGDLSHLAVKLGTYTNEKSEASRACCNTAAFLQVSSIS